MAKKAETTINKCEDRVEGLCLRRIRIAMRDGKGNTTTSGGRKAPSRALIIRQLIARIPKTGQAAEDLVCDVVSGKPCRYAEETPVYDKKTLQLSVCGVVVRKFRCLCKQTELLQAFQVQGWPGCIKLGGRSEVDPEKGPRDVLFRLNQVQNADSRRQVHFWNEPHDGGVHWEIIATASAGK